MGEWPGRHQATSRVSAGEQPVSLTFVIPVRHQENARDWPALKGRLAETLCSIASQTSGNWRAYVVANHGADLPPLPPRISAVWVDFPPNDMHELGKAGHDAFYDAFRWDKGRRVLSGMLAAGDTRFLMIVDDDDFVSNQLVGFVKQHPDANGWKIDRGYVWSEGGGLMLEHNNFHYLCGSSLIVRRDVYGLPPSLEAADVDWVKDWLGSHIRIGDMLENAGKPLAMLPFRGAVYRVGHAGSHSRASGILDDYVFNASLLARPRELLRNIRNLRRLTPKLRRAFFGD